MTRPNYVDITLLIDRSCSLAPLTRDVLEGLNGFVHEQRRLPLKQDITFSLMTFDHEYRIICDAIPIADAPRFTESHYQPRGNTCLYDALGRCIDDTGNRFRKMPEPERPSQVLFVALTDGLENASWKYDAAKLATMVEHQRYRYLWQFAFLGTNSDPWIEARRFGFRRDETAGWEHSSQGVRRAFDLLLTSGLSEVVEGLSAPEVKMSLIMADAEAMAITINGAALNLAFWVAEDPEKPDRKARAHQMLDALFDGLTLSTVPGSVV